jgi:hypothetical protein
MVNLSSLLEPKLVLVWTILSGWSSHRGSTWPFHGHEEKLTGFMHNGPVWRLWIWEDSRLPSAPTSMLLASLAFGAFPKVGSSISISWACRCDPSSMEASSGRRRKSNLWMQGPHDQRLMSTGKILGISGPRKRTLEYLIFLVVGMLRLSDATIYDVYLCPDPSCAVTTLLLNRFILHQGWCTWL